MAPFIIGIIGGITIIAGGTYLLEKIAEYIEQKQSDKKHLVALDTRLQKNKLSGRKYNVMIDL